MRVGTARARLQREAKSAASRAAPDPEPLERVQALLAPGDAVVEYAHLSDRVVALVVERGAARIARIGTSGAVDAACGACFDPSPAVDLEVPRAAVRRALAEPLALEPSVRRVLLSSDAEIASVAPAFLFPDLDVSCVGSGSVFVSLASDADLRGTGVLALGDPVYADAPTPGAATSRGRES